MKEVWEKMKPKNQDSRLVDRDASALEFRLEVANKEINKLKAKCTEKENKILDLRFIQGEVTVLQQENHELRREIRFLRQSGAVGSIDKREMETKEINKQVQAILKEKKETSEKLSRFKQEIKQANGDSSQKERSHFESFTMSHQPNLGEVTKELKEIKEKREVERNKLKLIEKELKRANQDNERLEKEKENEKKLVKELQSEIYSLKTRIQSSEKPGSNEGVRRQREESNERKVRALKEELEQRETIRESLISEQRQKIEYQAKIIEVFSKMKTMRESSKPHSEHRHEFQEMDHDRLEIPLSEEIAKLREERDRFKLMLKESAEEVESLLEELIEKEDLIRKLRASHSTSNNPI